MKNKTSLATRIARKVVSSEQAYHRMRKAQLLAMWALKRPHEKDFEYFRRFDGEKGLFVDVGANSGQSAVSFSLYNKSFDILSFEPYRQLELSLRFAQQLLGKRFRYRLTGLSDVDGTARLHVPVLGNLPLLARASMDESVVEELVQNIAADYDRPLRIESFEIELRTFDSLDLRPRIVKIDVEGGEPRVLRGMESTLREVRPVLMVERSDSLSECTEILMDCGYRQFVYQSQSKELVPIESASTSTNFFALPE